MVTQRATQRYHMLSVPVKYHTIRGAVATTKYRQDVQALFVKCGRRQIQQRWNEYVNMLLVCGECRQKCIKSNEIALKRFLDRHHPNRLVFSARCDYLRQTGSVDTTHRNQRLRLATGEDVEIDIVAAVTINPHVNSRAIARGICHTSVWRI